VAAVFNRDRLSRGLQNPVAIDIAPRIAGRVPRATIPIFPRNCDSNPTRARVAGMLFARLDINSPIHY
jgi:hypothetical protein